MEAGASTALLIGAHEVNGGFVSVKDLSSTQQTQFDLTKHTLADLASHLLSNNTNLA